MKYIQKPTVIQAAGNPPKQIEEFIGRVHCNGCRSEKQCFFCKSHCKWQIALPRKGRTFAGSARRLQKDEIMKHLVMKHLMKRQ